MDNNKALIPEIERDPSQPARPGSVHFVIRITILFLGLNVLSLLLGFGYFLIGYGLYRAIMTWPRLWKPAYDMLYRDFLGIQVDFTPQKFNAWRVIHTSLMSGVILLSIGVGIWILMNNSFCGQNLICRLVK
jgi:hypothetical protein